jgi:hypothetical protein
MMHLYSWQLAIGGSILTAFLIGALPLRAAVSSAPAYANAGANDVMRGFQGIERKEMLRCLHAQPALRTRSDWIGTRMRDKA